MKKMKKVMFALCVMFGGIVAVSAQDTTSNQYRTETQSQYPQDQDLERIQATELPDEVKRSLEGEEFRGWLISGAFKDSADPSMGADTTSADPSRQGDINATGAEGEEVYIVELKNGAETKTVTFSSNGQRLEGMEDTQNNPNNQFNQNDQMNQDDQLDPTTPPTTPPPPTQPTPTDPTTPDQPDPTNPSPPANPTQPDPTQPDPAQPAPSPGQPGHTPPSPGSSNTPPGTTEPK